MYSIVDNMKSTLQVLAIVAIAVAMIVALSNGTKIQKCDNDNRTSLADLTVQIGDCNDGRCVLERGKTYNFMVKFKAPLNDDNVQAMAIGSAHGFTMVIQSGYDEEACKSIRRTDKKSKKGEACPLKGGTHYIYDKQIKISDNEIRIEADVQWYLYNTWDIIYCFELPVQVK